MAVKNVVGLFDTTQDAHEAVRDLRDAGISPENISYVARNEQATVVEETGGGSEAAEGAAFGATGGTVVGGLTGLLVGLGALVIPGIGPVIAAGSIATALGTTALGAGIGAAAGGLLGALAGAGIPEEDANIYSEGIRRGGALVMAKVDEAQVDTVLDVMERHNVVDIDDRGRSYRDEGWSRFEGDPAYASAGTATAAAPGPMDSDTYERSSKAGTAGGALAGAATGAAMGSAGGPVGTVVGGVAGAVTGGAVGAAGDTAGQAADEADDTTSYSAADRDVTTTGSGVGTTDREALIEEDAAVSETRYTDSTADRIYDSTAADTGMAGSTAAGDTDRTIDSDDYERSSKAGTAGGGLADAATGAAMGSAGGPVGTVVGGVAGAVTGGAVGAAGDAAGAEASDQDRTAGTGSDVGSGGGEAYGSVTTTGPDMGTTAGGAPMAGQMAGPAGEPATEPDDKPSLSEHLTNTGERLFQKDFDNDGDIGESGRRNP